MSRTLISVICWVCSCNNPTTCWPKNPAPPVTSTVQPPTIFASCNSENQTTIDVALCLVSWKIVLFKIGRPNGHMGTVKIQISVKLRNLKRTFVTHRYILQYSMLRSLIWAFSVHIGSDCISLHGADQVACTKIPVSILHKSIAGRYRPVSVADNGPL